MTDADLVNYAKLDYLLQVAGFECYEIHAGGPRTYVNWDAMFAGLEATGVVVGEASSCNI